MTTNPTKLSLVEAPHGRRRHLTLERLTVDLYDREEYSLISGFEEDGNALGGKAIEKLFLCAGHVTEAATIPDALRHRLAADSELLPGRRLTARSSRSSGTFVERGHARQAETLVEQRQIQEKTQTLERQQRPQRQECPRVEGEIMGKRDGLIDQLGKRLAQRTQTETLFSIRWAVV